MVDGKKHVVIHNFFTKKLTALDEQGIDIAAKLHRLANTRGWTIFQTRTIKANDRNRIMLTPDDIPPTETAILGDLLSSDIFELSILLGDLTIQGPNAITSLPDCGKQEAHTDFPMKEELEATKKSYLVIAGLTDRCKIYVYYFVEGILHEYLVRIPRGSLFVGRGDLIHAGADYKSSTNTPFACNLRLHWYLDAKGNNRRPGDTHMISRNYEASPFMAIMEEWDREMEREKRRSMYYLGIARYKEKKKEKDKKINMKCLNMRNAKSKSEKLKYY
jgi:hypothetical protein